MSGFSSGFSSGFGPDSSAATGSAAFGSTATLSATGTATLSPTRSGSAALTATATLTASGVALIAPPAFGSISLTATATLTAVGVARLSGAANLAASVTLFASGVGTITPTTVEVVPGIKTPDTYLFIPAVEYANPTTVADPHPGNSLFSRSHPRQTGVYNVYILPGDIVSTSVPYGVTPLATFHGGHITNPTREQAILLRAAGYTVIGPDTTPPVVTLPPVVASGSAFLAGSARLTATGTAVVPPDYKGTVALTSSATLTAAGYTNGALTPRLAVSGASIVLAGTSTPVILRGANFMSHDHRGQTSTIAAGLAAMRTGWGGNIGVFGYASRAVMNNTPHPYSTTPYLTLLDQIVSSAKANGCYVVLAARWSGIEGRDTDNGSPTQQQYLGIPPQEAIDSLAKLATRYLAEPHVMLACQVETNGNVTWAQARDYYQACLTAVRNTTSQAIVMSSGLDFGKTVNGAVANPVVGSGFVYKTHIYERQTNWSAQFTAAVDAGLPLFVGEFGQPSDFGEPYVMDQTEVGNVISYTSSHGIGWAGWAFEADQTPRMVLNETGFDPVDPFGLSLRNEMLKTPPVPGQAERAVAPTPLSLDGTVTSDTQITWTWTAVASPVRYEYRIGTTGTPTTNGTSTTFAQTVTAGTAVTLQVRSVTAAGTSLWSPAVTRTATGGLSISRAKPVTASLTSQASPVGVLVDGQWDTDSYLAPSYPVVVTLDLSTVPTGQLGPVSIGWAMDQYNSDNLIQDAQFQNGNPSSALLVRGTTYNEPGAYTFQGATSSSGPWTTLVTVTDNVNRSRTHRADLTGYTWLRWNLTAGNPGNEPQYNNRALLTKLEVVSGSATDSWLFTGDSITCAGSQVSNGLGSKVEALAPARKPLIQPLGIPGSRAIDFAPGGFVSYRARWLAWLTETACKNVTINLGTNDAGYSIPAATFNTALRALIADVTSRGLVPWVPTIPWNSVATANVQALNAVIAQIYTDLPAVQRGPDMYAYYLAHPDQIEPTSPYIHPTGAGYSAWSDLWAQTIAGASLASGTFTANFQGTF